MGIAPTIFFAICAVFEEDHRRDREDFVLGGGLLVLVDVEAEDLEVVALGVDLLEDRVDDAARAAPRGPEVDEDGALGVEDVGFEGGVGYVGQFSTHGDRFPRSRFEAHYFRKYSALEGLQGSYPVDTSEPSSARLRPLDRRLFARPLGR